tara:strand:+ start:7243 stop:7908 length:666 start_codon:yes stop_codon:yes gene_type:complete
MLNFENITKSYSNGNNKNIILDSVDISVKLNSISLIKGMSGVGKSTLLNIMGCLIKPDNGKLNFNGKTISLLDNNEKFRLLNFSYVFQNFNLLPEFTVYENLLIPAYINNLDINRIKKKADDLLDYMNVEHLKESYPNLISHGEKQRISFLRTLLGNQKIILADEPTGNLDEINTKIILDLIVKINVELNYTFIIVSHDSNFDKISSNIYGIEKKKIVRYE